MLDVRLLLLFVGFVVRSLVGVVEGTLGVDDDDEVGVVSCDLSAGECCVPLLSLTAFCRNFTCFF